MKVTIKTRFEKDATGKMVPTKGTIYSHKIDTDTYSIMLINNTKYYRFNDKSWSNTINDVHHIIEKHYGI